MTGQPLTGKVPRLSRASESVTGKLSFLVADFLVSGHEHHHAEGSRDPHGWLDLLNAAGEKLDQHKAEKAEGDT